MGDEVERFGDVAIHILVFRQPFAKPLFAREIHRSHFADFGAAYIAVAKSVANSKVMIFFIFVYCKNVLSVYEK